MLLLSRNERNLEEDLLKAFFGNCFLDDVNSSRGVMRTDVEETEDACNLKINLPGFKKEDLDINFEDGYLTVKAEVNNKKEKKDEKKFVLKERFNEKLSRTYYLGDNIDTESIKANLSDGVLEVTCKKVTKPIKNILID